MIIQLFEFVILLNSLLGRLSTLGLIGYQQPIFVGSPRLVMGYITEISVSQKSIVD